MNIKDRVVERNIEFKNRIVMPPMATAKADENGNVTEEILNYYEEKTRNRMFAAVIVEHNFVDKRGKAHSNQMSVAEDSSIEGLAKLAKVIKNNDALAILQISHAGSASKEKDIGMKPVAPTAILHPSRKDKPEMPVELSKKDIEEIRDRFIKAAMRAKKAGFDGIEIHSAHGYLLDQFLSPLSNKREDEYGKDIYGRIKLHLDIIRGIRKAVGSEYPVFIRMGAGDFIEGGLSEADSVIAAKEFEKAGVDVIDISGGMCFYTIQETKPGYFDIISKPIYDAVNIPVILTGGVKQRQDIVDILDRNVCDLIGVGRSVFRDSNWMDKEVKGLLNK